MNCCSLPQRYAFLKMSLFIELFIKFIFFLDIQAQVRSQMAVCDFASAEG